ncbi:hypothetical protein JST56_07745 [Candidatus Dependentiae bacterium]|nr:hypothetical protein [Candidatus Dependentiae bacterium]
MKEEEKQKLRKRKIDWLLKEDNDKEQEIGITKERLVEIGFWLNSQKQCDTIESKEKLNKKYYSWLLSKTEDDIPEIKEIQIYLDFYDLPPMTEEMLKKWQIWIECQKECYIPDTRVQDDLIRCDKCNSIGLEQNSNTCHICREVFFDECHQVYECCGIEEDYENCCCEICCSNCIDLSKQLCLKCVK